MFGEKERGEKKLLGFETLMHYGRSQLGGSSTIFLPDSKFSGGSIGLERQKKIPIRQTKTKSQNRPESPMLPPLPKLGHNRPMVETPSPPTQYQQENACVSELLTPLVGH